MSKKIFKTDQAPAPIGPYNQAVEINGILFVSGQVALIPSTGEMITNDVVAETHQVMKNIEAILTEAGLNFSNIVKASIFLSDMGLFATVNEVYSQYFTADFPARECVAVKTLPKNANVEISVIAGR